MIKNTLRTLLIVVALAMAMTGLAIAGSDADEKGIEAGRAELRELDL